MDCIFCSIVKGEIPSDKVYEDEFVYAFKDVNPEAPVHILVIPKKHIKSLNQINKDNVKIIEKIYLAIGEIVKKEGINETGYRVVANTLGDGGQSVDHLHFHVLGGRKLTWPPG
ncbi:MAG: histidine triad nucleotide-binding protein [Clostridium sp.]|nr:histidine triad nucleotide-binding protein [Clostridium sp.]